MRLITSILIALGLGIFTATSAWSAPIIWNSGTGANNNWYDLVLISPTAPTQDWIAARDAAAATMWMGAAGHLVTITSAEENAFLASNFVTAGSDDVGYTGGADSTVEGVWRWMVGPEAGNLVSFTAWSAGEPNNFNNWNEDFIGFITSPGGKGQASWVDVPQNSASFGFPVEGYFVEWEASDIKPSGVPEPSALLLLASGLFGMAFRRSRVKIKRL